MDFAVDSAVCAFLIKAFVSIPAFKLAQVDMYRQRLKERQRRKRIAREYSIIQTATTTGIKKAQANKKKISKDEK